MVKLTTPSSWRAGSFAGLALLLSSTSHLPAAQAAFEVQDGKLQSISSAGIAEHTATFPSIDAHAKVVTLSSLSTLRLSYTITPTDEASYSALILSTVDERALATALGQPTNTSESHRWRLANSQVTSVTIPLQPKKGGRYRFEWDLSSPSNAYKEDILTIARLSEGRLKARLMAVNAKARDDPRTLYMDLGTVAILDEEYYRDNKMKKYPREWEMERYGAREEISWTFREATRPVSSFKALIGVGAVLAPWFLLLGLTSQILPSLSVTPSPSSLPFLLSLSALEGSIASYWVGLITVWTFMPCVAAIGLLSILTGKSALGSKMKERIGVEGNRAVGVEGGGVAVNKKKDL
ncbi:hypothetical protein P389DRAFT_167021 [Cystobasidium minutum MCA 4210]|uniref:uncharacterized protein n=1 Tax=Cystobasidium minutum MCA 4210 TaxID=1397322 RepID=UPI0034CFE105|eukprot:jgi/Rhomi1/167021/fgenesh1_kg.2_\